jgi:hypothetical protein
MKMKTSTSTVALTLGLVVLFSSFSNTCKADSSYEKKAGTIAADVFVFRPSGVLLMVTGTALFVLIVPATWISGGTRDCANTLVKTPYQFTFRRPIGTDLRDYIDDY